MRVWWLLGWFNLSNDHFHSNLYPGKQLRKDPDPGHGWPRPISQNMTQTEIRIDQISWSSGSVLLAWFLPGGMAQLLKGVPSMYGVPNLVWGAVVHGHCLVVDEGRLKSREDSEPSRHISSTLINNCMKDLFTLGQKMSQIQQGTSLIKIIKLSTGYQHPNTGNMWIHNQHQPAMTRTRPYDLMTSWPPVPTEPHIGASAKELGDPMEVHGDGFVEILRSTWDMDHGISWDCIAASHKLDGSSGNILHSSNIQKSWQFTGSLHIDSIW